MNIKRLLVFIALLGIATAGTIFTVNAVQANTLEEQYDRANEAFKEEDFQKSVEVYLKVLEMDPSHHEARLKLAQSYIHLDQIEKAVETLNEGIYESPEVGSLYTLLSDLYVQEGSIDKAYRTLEKGKRYSKETSVQEAIDQLLSNITVDTERRFVQEGYEREYRLVWSSEEGNLYPLDAEWSVENADIGEIAPVEDDISVMFKGTEVGRTEVVVSWEDYTETMELVVKDQVLEEVSFDELEAFSIGQTSTLEVIGKDAAGEEMTFEPKWTLSEEKFELEASEQTATLTAEESGLDVLTLSYQDFTKEIPLMVEGENESYIQTNVEGQGRIVITPEKESYEQGDDIQLQAVGEPGWTFVQWAGDLEGNQSTIQHTIEGNLNVTAIFETSLHTLNLTIEGEGEVFRDSLTNTYPHGETISLRARPASGWTFEGWEGDVTASTTNTTLTFDEDKQLRAVFVEKDQEDEEQEDEGEGEEEEIEEEKETTEYRLNVGKSGKGTIKQSQSGSRFEDGTLVTLTATPSNGYKFVGWRGDVNHSSRTVTIKMNSHYSVKAVFQEIAPEPAPEPDPEPEPQPEPEPELYTLSTSTDGQGYIRVSKQTVSAGESISIQAIPAEGWTFVRWKRDGSGSSASTSITMNRNKQVTAVFEQVKESTSEEE
ncbi:tetratricopeptide repeat protein [Halobacillus litoralis]|uniref:Tetratricopeptide repeat protein n=1 Tax=Halobacillus litoralis TaxID=45668 RepID=A0A845E178_9BACI|nr:InlB B-repeat-containing protein [Halobacillus litoralis]MYL49365.1 tetratricopeptide repeat protein [Halobacillus litoralis]